LAIALDEIQNDITRETPACFEPSIDYVVIKIPRFTFEKFPEAKDILGVQMKSRWGNHGHWPYILKKHCKRAYVV
jgi:carbamoyl-phosphate synthase large subunit